MKGDEAVSAVIGTVFTLVLVVAALATYQLAIVPDKTEQAEARQMATVERGMNDLTADLLDQVLTVAHAPSASPVALSRDQPLFAAEETSTGSLSFQPQAVSTTVTSPSLNIVTRNGDPQLSGSGTGSPWQTVQNGDTIEDINGVIGLRIKIIAPDPSDNDRLSIVATDADGDYAGDLQAIVRVNPPDLDLIVQTRAPPEPGEVVFHNHIITTHRERWDSHYWLDAMLDLYWFDSLLADATKPATLTFQDQGLDAEYKVAYERRVSSGLTTVVGAGQIVPDYEDTRRSGTITYTSQNEHYPDQTLTVEQGALVRSQVDGSAFAIDPPFQAEAAGGIAKIGLTIPSLEGPADTISGAGVATLLTQSTERGSYGATAGQLTFAFDTDHPDLWASFLDRELTDAGLTSEDCPPSDADSDCQFEISTDPEEGVELTVHGPHAHDADPTDPERDLSVNVGHGTIRTEVQR